MMARHRGPGAPGDDSGPAPPGDPDHVVRRHHHHVSTGYSHEHIAAGQRRNRPWRCRREASWRMVALDCGCRDPWPCRCTTPPLTDHALDGWRDAARHILDCGQIPLVPLEIRRALWRRQGADRLLVERLHQACGEAAS